VRNFSQFVVIGLWLFTAESAESAEMVKNVNDVTEAIIGAAICVHRELGPGLLESAYEACLAYELVERKLKIERQKALRRSINLCNFSPQRARRTQRCPKI